MILFSTLPEGRLINWTGVTEERVSIGKCRRSKRNEKTQTNEQEWDFWFNQFVTWYELVQKETNLTTTTFYIVVVFISKQVLGTDVTATSGTSIVFASALANGDVVDIVCYGTFNVAAVAGSAINSGTINAARMPLSIAADWESKSANFTAAGGKAYFCDTSSGAIDVTLPASPAQKDTIRFLDVAGTFDTNDLTILAGSHKIQGAAANLDVATERAGFEIIYYEPSFPE